MTQLLARPEETDEELTDPTVQILWLDRGRLVEAPPPSLVPLHRVTPAGWYADRLRLWDGRDWTDEVRPIHCPSPVMCVGCEEAFPAEPKRPLSAESQIAARTEIGLLGLPPPLAPEPSTPAHLVMPNNGGPSEVGLIGLPPAILSPTTRRASIALEVKRGLISGLKSSCFVLVCAIGAVALVAAVGILSSL
jgi:hypothetical protein